MWMVTLGTAGPAMTGAAMLLLYEVAMALFVGLGPIFILCLLFDATKALFQRWLLYGIGTLFSMAVLAAMVGIATDLVSAVAEAFWATSVLGALTGNQFSSGISSAALQQGGIGLLLTVLLISTPPMVAVFFQGTMGSFLTNAQISGTYMPPRPGDGQRNSDRINSYQQNTVDFRNRDTSHQPGVITDRPNRFKNDPSTQPRTSIKDTEAQKADGKMGIANKDRSIEN